MHNDPRVTPPEPKPSPELAVFTTTDAAICSCALLVYWRDLRDLPKDQAETALQRALETDPTLERFTCWGDYLLYVRELVNRMAALGGLPLPK